MKPLWSEKEAAKKVLKADILEALNCAHANAEKSKEKEAMEYWFHVGPYLQGYLTSMFNIDVKKVRDRR